MKATHGFTYRLDPIGDNPLANHDHHALGLPLINLMLTRQVTRATARGSRGGALIFIEGEVGGERGCLNFERRYVWREQIKKFHGPLSHGDVATGTTDW